MTTDDELNTKGLDDLLKALKGKLPTVSVGILGKNTRSSSATFDQVVNGKVSFETNASIGAKHEFGEVTKFGKLPVRSFLRVPITDHLQKYLDASGAFEEDSIKKVIKEKSLVSFLKKIGIVAENIVSDAFATGGFGLWKPSNMAFKKNHQTLVETQQLRNSITSRVN